MQENGRRKRQRDISDFIKMYTEYSSIIEARIKEKVDTNSKNLFAQISDKCRVYLNEINRDKFKP